MDFIFNAVLIVVVGLTALDVLFGLIGVGVSFVREGLDYLKSRRAVNQLLRDPPPARIKQSGGDAVPPPTDPQATS